MEPVIKKAYESCLQRQSFAFATVIQTKGKGTPRKVGAKMIVFSDGTIEGTIGGGVVENQTIRLCQQAIKTKKAQTVTINLAKGKGPAICGGEMQVFIEPFVTNRHLIICGAGHIALPLSIIFKMLNTRVTIIDNRKELMDKKRFPHVDRILVGKHAQLLTKQQINCDTAIVIVTHGHEHDFECLKAVMKSTARYIGVIGSLTKRNLFMRQLKALGSTPHNLKKIQMPAGVDIGAQTPPEIALSISAEIVSVFNHEYLNSDKYKMKRNYKKK